MSVVMLVIVSAAAAGIAGAMRGHYFGYVGPDVYGFDLVVTWRGDRDGALHVAAVGHSVLRLRQGLQPGLQQLGFA